MFQYGKKQSPSQPGPEIKLLLCNNSKESYKINAIIDTGADITCIPESVIFKVFGEDICYSPCTLISFNTTKQYNTYYIDIIVGGCKFHNVEVLGIEDNFGIIGRDLLNKYKLEFDGPNLSWRVLSNDCKRIS